MHTLTKHAILSNVKAGIIQRVNWPRKGKTSTIRAPILFTSTYRKQAVKNTCMVLPCTLTKQKRTHILGKTGKHSSRQTGKLVGGWTSRQICREVGGCYTFNKQPLYILLTKQGSRKGIDQAGKQTKCVDGCLLCQHTWSIQNLHLFEKQ